MNGHITLKRTNETKSTIIFAWLDGVSSTCTNLVFVKEGKG